MKFFLVGIVAFSYYFITVQGDDLDANTDSFFICQAGESLFLGEYLPGKEKVDGVPVYSNLNEMSFFRNRGYWYLGNLKTWPPRTHYRCVEMEGCNQNLITPPTTTEGKWTASKIGIQPIPVVSKEKCADVKVEEDVVLKIDEL